MDTLLTLLSGFLLSAAPTAGLIFGLVLWLRRQEPDWRDPLFLALAWGAVLAGPLSWFLGRAISGLLPIFLPSQAVLAITVIALSPVIEEVLKAAAPVAGAKMGIRRLDVALCGLAAGLGFALLENFMMVMRSLSAGAMDWDAFISSLLWRIGGTTPMHGLATLAAGVGAARGPVALAAGLAAAIGIHAVWNLAAWFDAGTAARYGWIFWVLLIGALVTLPLLFPSGRNSDQSAGRE